MPGIGWSNAFTLQTPARSELQSLYESDLSLLSAISSSWDRLSGRKHGFVRHPPKQANDHVSIFSRVWAAPAVATIFKSQLNLGIGHTASSFYSYYKSRIGWYCTAHAD